MCHNKSCRFVLILLSSPASIWFLIGKNTSFLWEWGMAGIKSQQCQNWFSLAERKAPLHRLASIMFDPKAKKVFFHHKQKRMSRLGTCVNGETCWAQLLAWLRKLWVLRPSQAWVYCIFKNTSHGYVRLNSTSLWIICLLDDKDLHTDRNNIEMDENIFAFDRISRLKNYYVFIGGCFIPVPEYQKGLGLDFWGDFWGFF